MSDLKDKLKELAGLAAAVPENLQAICFELLLRDYLASLPGRRDPAPKPNPNKEVQEATPKPEKTIEEAARNQADLTMTDTHVKTRKFMEKHGVTIEELNNLFYKEGATIQPLYDDVRTTKMSEAQIRITLLQALRNGLTDGEFSTQVDSVRTECRDRKALDGPNFAATYKNNATLFDFDKYDKDTKELRLSEAGRKQLAQLIKTLQ